jgi:hypothetical protein
VGFPGRNLLLQGRLVSDASVQALPVLCIIRFPRD